MFYLVPKEVYVNGIKYDSCLKFCELPNYKNNVTLVFDDYLTSCKNMFNGLKNIKEIDLSNFDTSDVTSFDSMFQECNNLEKINFGQIETKKVKNMNNLFKNCFSLTSIDLSHFDTSSLNTMEFIFSGCKSLESIDLTKFNTTNVKSMCDLISYCDKMISISLSNFDTSNVRDMQGMFYQSSKLKYLDLRYFNTLSADNLAYFLEGCELMKYVNLRWFVIDVNNPHNINYTDVFGKLPSDTKLCIENVDTRNIILGNKINDCSDFCFQENIIYAIEKDECICNENYKFEYNNQCYNECNIYKYPILQNKYICSNIIPENYYLDKNDNIYKECYYLCKKCSVMGNEDNNNCDECIDDYIFLNESFIPSKNCYHICDNYFYFNENSEYICTDSRSCPSNFDKLVVEKNKCIDKCINDNDYIYEYNNECLKQCPSETKENEEEKKCYRSCPEDQFEYNKKCYIICPSNTFKIFKNRIICSDILPEENYYLDSYAEIYKPCFNSCLTCFGEGDEENNNCIECKHNFILLNEINKEKNCFPCEFNYYIKNNSYFCTDNLTCPKEYPKLIKNKKKCISKCINDNVYQYEYNNICYDNCPNRTYYSNINKICYDNNMTVENYIQKEISKIREYITNGKMNDTDYIVKIGNVSIQITNSEIQNNNINKNISTIDFGLCENDLRNIYKINKSFPLLIYKIDYYPNDTLIPIIGYEVYHPINYSLLNLSYCSNNTIKLYIPITIDENNLFKYDPKSSYYTNSCHSYTTEDGTDIILKDRQKEYENKNMSLCENKCKYLGYNISNKQSSCICEIKDRMEPISEIIKNPNKLSQDFETNKDSSSSNIISMECTYVLFTVDGIKSNISSYLLLIIIFYFLFSITTFIKCGYPLLKMDIQNIIAMKKKDNNQKKENKNKKKIKFYLIKKVKIMVEKK